MKEHKSQCGGSLASDRVMKYVNSGQKCLNDYKSKAELPDMGSLGGKVNTYELTGGKRKKRKTKSNKKSKKSNSGSTNSLGLKKGATFTYNNMRAAKEYGRHMKRKFKEKKRTARVVAQKLKRLEGKKTAKKNNRNNKRSNVGVRSKIKGNRKSMKKMKAKPMDMAEKVDLTQPMAIEKVQMGGIVKVMAGGASCNKQTGAGGHDNKKQRGGEHCNKQTGGAYGMKRQRGGTNCHKQTGAGGHNNKKQNGGEHCNKQTGGGGFRSHMGCGPYNVASAGKKYAHYFSKTDACPSREEINNPPNLESAGSGSGNKYPF